MKNEDVGKNDPQQYSNLAAMEREPSDQDILAENPLPTPLDEGEVPSGQEIETVSGPKPFEKPKKYGPFQVTEILAVKDNLLGRPQKSVRAIFQGPKPASWLISAFDSKVSVLDQVEVGASYNFWGVAKVKATPINGEKRASFYLNIV